MNGKLLSTLSVIAFTTGSIYAQGQYLPPGQNGVGISASLGGNEDATSFGASVGYSVRGMFDFGIGLTRVAFDEGLMDSEGEIADFGATAVSPYINIHVVKQDPEHFPLSVVLGGSYEYGSYDSDALDDYDVKMSVGSWVLGGSIFSTLDITPSFQIQPGTSVAFIRSKFTMKDSFDSVSDTETTTSFGFGLSLIFKSSEAGKFVLSPGLSVAEDTPTFSVDAGFVFITP